MRFIGLDKDTVRSLSVVSEDYYVYTLGVNIDVISAKVLHRNRFMTTNLSTGVISDNFLVKYVPSNTIYFSKQLIDSDVESISCYIDIVNKCLMVGTLDEFDVRGGILAFSGDISANGYVEKERYVYCVKRYEKIIKDLVKPLSVGLVGSTVFGVMYIPARKGVYVGLDSKFCISTETFEDVKIGDCLRYRLSDWFESSMIKEADYAVRV